MTLLHNNSLNMFLMMLMLDDPNHTEMMMVSQGPSLDVRGVLGTMVSEISLPEALDLHVMEFLVGVLDGTFDTVMLVWGDGDDYVGHGFLAIRYYGFIGKSYPIYNSHPLCYTTP